MPDWLNYSGLEDVTLFGVALYGAALSTFNLLQSVRKDRRTVRVTARTGMYTFQDGSLSPPIAILEATNAGHRAVMVSTITFQLDGGARLFPMAANRFPGMTDTLLPSRLSDGETARVHMSYREIAEALQASGRNKSVKIYPVCEDSVGKTYRGQPWTFDPIDYATRT